MAFTLPALRRHFCNSGTQNDQLRSCNETNRQRIMLWVNGLFGGSKLFAEWLQFVVGNCFFASAGNVFGGRAPITCRPWSWKCQYFGDSLAVHLRGGGWGGSEGVSVVTHTPLFAKTAGCTTMRQTPVETRMNQVFGSFEWAGGEQEPVSCNSNNDISAAQQQ